MPDTPPNQPTSPPTPAPSSPTPPSGTPTSSAELANMVAPEYRYPENDTVPEYLRGKTAGEAAQMLQAVVEAAGRSAAAAPPPPAPLSQPADDDYVTAAHLKQASASALAQVNPWLQTVAEQQANLSYSLAKERDKSVFAKYEPEIIQVLQSVPRHQWTLDVIKKAVTMVKGSHVDELVADKVRGFEQTMTATMRSTGRAGMPLESPNQETVASSLAKTPPEWLAHAKAVGIDENSVWEFCKATDTTPEEFFKDFQKGLVTDAIAEVNFKRGMTAT